MNFEKKQKKTGVSVPGFLLLQYPNQVRKEEKFAKGGGGSIYSGLLLDQELITKNETNKVVLKEVERPTVYSNKQNEEFFLQEVSMMWFVFLVFRYISFCFEKKKFFFFFDFRACSFHPNVIKLIGYVLEPEYYIITKRYELDLFHFIHHPNEDLPPLLALKLTK